MNPAVHVRHFTDPGCPWAFSAEPRLRRLEWLYGDALAWETTMVVLSESPEDYVERGFTPAKMAGGQRQLFERFRMPIDWTERPRMAATVDACRAVVAARLNAPEAERPLLRNLRVLNMGGGLLDDPALLDRAAADAGLDPADVRDWAEDPAVADALATDKAAARSPAPGARALDHKLAGPGEERRYTCPSLEFAVNGTTVAVPGFQPTESYEAAIANLAPELGRRAAPGSAAEVLAWAGMPLATAEVAAVCEADEDDVRADLSRSATFEPVGGDGYWSVR